MSAQDAETRAELERFMSFMTDADCLYVEDDIGDGMVCVCPANSKTGIVMAGMGLITDRESVVTCGLPVYQGHPPARIDGPECVCGEINMRHCPIHQNAQNDGSEDD